ncbi:MAG: hypothetical protein FJ014_09540 [Chloroflexi bacterium]|nr:hypothetical protein [Chloroflexota bacterium]
MALYDLADPAVPLPPQLVVDSSLLLALRPGDDNPHAFAAQRFIRRLRQQIAAYQMVAWLLMPVLQECYHVILANSLRRTLRPGSGQAWAAMDTVARPPNWLVMYKRQLFHHRLLLAASGCTHSGRSRTAGGAGRRYP